MNYKQEAAKRALTLIANRSKVGLGAGSTIAYLVELLQQEKQNGLEVELVTSSFSTLQLLNHAGFNVQSISAISHLDIYFDGCDQFDRKLNALKSGGGIHTHEKLCASMADTFVLLGDETKYVEEFDTRYPLVIEVLPEAFTYVRDRIGKFYKDIKTAYRLNDKRDGPVITPNGNYLLDIWFSGWASLPEINPTLKGITGIVETSLFFDMAHKAIIAGAGGVQVLQK